MYSTSLMCSCLLVFVSGIIALEKLPDFIQTCKRNSKLSTCVSGRIEALRPYLERGIPNLTLPSIDPLYVDVLHLERDDPKIGHYNVTLTDIVGTGVKDFEIVCNEVDVDNLRFKIKIDMPHMKLHCDISANGEILGFKLTEEFKAIFDAWNIVLDLSASGKLFIKEGEPHIKWEDDNSFVNYEKASAKVTDFDEDSKIDHNFNKALSENMDLMNPFVTAVFKKTVTKFLIEALNHVHEKYSLDVLYPLK